VKKAMWFVYEEGNVICVSRKQCGLCVKKAMWFVCEEGLTFER
jgi:hypothetical protein